MSGRFSRIFISVVVIGFAIAGCKSNSSGPNSNPSVAVTRPGVGSVFLSHYQGFAPSGSPVAAYDEWDTVVVVSSGISYEGKSSVVAYKLTAYYDSTNSTDEAVFYLNYESNGDISKYIASDGYPGDRSGWEIIPMASEGTTSFDAFDTSFTDPTGASKHPVLTNEYSYTGEDTVKEAGTSFDTRSFLYNQYDNGEASPYPETDWWAPSIGFMVQMRQTLSEPIGYGASRFTTDLVSYTLK